MTTEERLDRIERELAAMRDGQVVRAARFVLVDERGRERAALQMIEDEPSLVLWDPYPLAGAYVHLDEEGRPCWSIFD